MKRLHIITLAVLAASVLALGVTTLVRSIGNDKTIPEIVCSDTPLRLSVQDGEAGLLQDVTARDGNDGDLTGSLQITRLRVRLVLATGDAAQTGILLGQTAALCGILVPFLENTFDLRDIHVRADPDFEKDKTEWAAEVFCAIRPITFIRIVFRHRKPLRRLYELLKRGVKA